MRTPTRLITGLAGLVLAGALPAAPAATDAPGGADGPEAAAGMATDPAALVGRRVPPYPEPLADLGGTCFSAPAPGPGSEVCAYSVSIHGPEAGNPTHAMVLKAVGRDGDNAVWRVLEVVERPPIDGAGFVHYGCEPLDGDAVVVLAVADLAPDGEWYEPVHRAWAFDFATERLRGIDVAGVRCINEGYGYDG